MLERLLNPDNPIVLLTERTRARQAPRWLHVLDTRIPYLLMPIMILVFLYGLGTDRYYSSPIWFGSINSQLFVIYWLVALRFTIEGVAIGRLVQQGVPDLLRTTAISTARIVFGIWGSTLHRMRAWALLLVYCWVLAGLIRTIVTVNNHPGASSMVIFLYTLCFLLPLSLFTVSGAIGMGAAIGMALRRWEGAVAIGVAFTVQLIPTLLVIILLTLNNPYGPLQFNNILDSLFGWETFIAFGDSGLTAVTRLANEGVSFFGSVRISIMGVSPQIFLAMICTLHVHLLLTVGSATALAFQLRPFIWPAEVRQPFKLWNRGAGVLPYALFIGAALVLVVIWLGIPRVPLTIDLPPFPYINRDLLRAVQYFMAVVLTLCVIRSIAAGVYTTHSGDSAFQWEHFLTTTRATVSRLRGWILGLSLLLMLLFVLLIIDHFMNGLGLRALAAHEGYWWRWGAQYRYEFRYDYGFFFLQWSPLQVIGAVAWATIMGYGVIIGGVVLGLGARLLWRRRWLAFVGAFVLRVLLVLIGLLPPNYFTLPHPGLLATRLDHDPLFTIADSGLTVVIGLAEPGWTVQDVCGRTLAGFGVILGVITFYGLLLVSLLPLMVVWLRRIHRWHSSTGRSFRNRTMQKVTTELQPP